MLSVRATGPRWASRALSAFAPLAWAVVAIVATAGVVYAIAALCGRIGGAP